MLLELHRANFTTRQIAARMFVSTRTVTRWLGKLIPDWERTGFGNPMSEEQKERMVALAKEQLPPSWIAEDVGLEESTVNNFRRRMELPGDAEWKGIAIAIRRDPALFALHKEFRPS